MAWRAKGSDSHWHCSSEEHQEEGGTSATCTAWTRGPSTTPDAEIIGKSANSSFISSRAAPWLHVHAGHVLAPGKILGKYSCKFFPTKKCDKLRCTEWSGVNRAFIEESGKRRYGSWLESRAQQLHAEEGLGGRLHWGIQVYSKADGYHCKTSIIGDITHWKSAYLVRTRLWVQSSTAPLPPKGINKWTKKMIQGLVIFWCRESDLPHAG